MISAVRCAQITAAKEVRLVLRESHSRRRSVTKVFARAAWDEIIVPNNNDALSLARCTWHEQMIKRLCRKLGMPRWPFRQIDSINKAMEDLHDQLEGARTEADRARCVFSLVCGVLFFYFSLLFACVACVVCRLFVVCGLAHPPTQTLCCMYSILADEVHDTVVSLYYFS